MLSITVLGLLGCTGYMDGGTDSFDRAPIANADAAGASGGGGGAGGSDAGPPQPITHDQLSNEAITSLLTGFKYRGEGYRKVNQTPFPSTVSPDKTVTLWISEGGYDAYTQISPDMAGSNAKLPVGSVIVREVLKGSALDAITVMLRLPTGSFPLGGDWWYCSAGADGVIKTDATHGTPLIGLLENCGTCHLRRRDDDHLFGAPAEFID